MEKIIDVHNHLFPKEWLDYLETRTSSPRMERNQGLMVVHAYDVLSYAIDNPGHYDPEVRVKDLDKFGIDVQILSLTIPSIEELDVDDGVKWAKKVNDYFADVCHKYPGRFYAYATLPFQDLNEALKELDRAYNELSVKGITMFSNINFVPLSSPEFYPIYARAEAYGLPIFIHPGVPYNTEVLKEHKLLPGLYGYTFETTMAIMSLIWTGVMEKYPGLNIIHAHLGGVVPYLVRRMEDCYRAALDQKLLDNKLPKSPSEYYRRQVYPDSMSAYLPAMKCCLDFVGPEHMCLGTDYAHRIGNWEEAIAFVKALDLSEKDTNSILGGNAARIFDIE